MMAMRKVLELSRCRPHRAHGDRGVPSGKSFNGFQHEAGPCQAPRCYTEANSWWLLVSNEREMPPFPEEACAQSCMWMGKAELLPHPRFSLSSMAQPVSPWASLRL